MKLQAEVSCEYKNESISQTVASSIRPDNLDAPENVKIKTTESGNRVKSEIEVENGIETMLNTLDDLLSCISTAEKMI